MVLIYREDNRIVLIEMLTRSIAKSKNNRFSRPRVEKRISYFETAFFTSPRLRGF